MINLESADSNYSAIGIHKKISSLPLSEIEKVNELMATHYRPQDDHHGFHISYKLKMVIILLVIGILFLLFDTLSDRKYKKKIALSQDHHTNHAK
jgi:Ca2+/Na+ antiporter